MSLSYGLKRPWKGQIIIEGVTPSGIKLRIKKDLGKVKYL
jgi:hypothetical protein